MAKVNIFYQELNYRRVDETPVYSVSQPGTHGLGGAGAVAGQTPQGPAVGTCSPPPDACRCPSCCQPWAASGACGSAPRSSLCWSCWSCCLTPWLSWCFGAAAGSTQLRGPSWGQPQGQPPRSQEPSSYPLTAGISTIWGALLALCPAILPGALARVFAEELGHTSARCPTPKPAGAYSDPEGCGCSKLSRLPTGNQTCPPEPLPGSQAKPRAREAALGAPGRQAGGCPAHRALSSAGYLPSSGLRDAQGSGQGSVPTSLGSRV